ncbi:SHIRT domain-containing protein [Aedoeadaptatus pacaensis]|uniref:SHIRT domain-containing protein n=1 Tax=Aedoeadaptatus pacaensis TaxID=1776390 RepID=UPI0008399BED|nr:SHIRT domain-containing protein [Peptoniphilus pacaensis]
MNKHAHPRRSRIYMMILALVLVLVSGKTPVFAATDVGSFDELKTAVEAGDEIKLTKDIVVTETLEIKDKDVKISGEGYTLTLANDFSKDQMFKVDGKALTLNKVTLDGKKQGRLIYSERGTITLNESTLKNGCPGANAKANPGGGVFLRGGSLTATKTDFIGNTPGTTQGLDEGDRDLNGGAIYSGKTSADIKITGGSFEDNEVKAYGHGAAIYQENGSLTVTGTSFKNNKGHAEGGNAGTQGACIHTRDKVTAKISNVEAEISKGFNTGGFLRSLGSTVKVNESTFTIANQGDGYGYSGGVFCFQNGTSEVKASTFKCTDSKLYHAGGFIDIVGAGAHVIDGNKMTGAGKENGQQIASFGGAISVEQGANATVTIKDNTIKDSSASDNGGAIAIGTRKGESTPSTVTMSGNKISNAGTLFWGAQHGGGIFIGPEATVTMSNDTMSDTRSSYGGGIYNEGNLTISGGSSLTGGVGSKLGGEIYNNGDLTVDKATVAGNFVGPANWNQTPGHEKKYEHGGTNIYAEKSVTITPEASLTTGKDVRVLDGQSKILLTGALTKEIDVSISEIAGGSEKAKRQVGYVIAEGKDDYKATKADANFLHYIGRTNKEDASHYSNQPRAAFADDKSTGEWDFVLDKDNKKVVLGQRVKLIYHGNLGKLGENDSAEKTVDVYKNPNFWEGQLEEYQVADPELEGSSFMGWYFWKDGDSVEDTDDSIQNIKIPDDLREKLFDFSRVEFENNEENTDKIITPNIIHTYAGWSQNIELGVSKAWEDAEDADKVDVTVTLKGGDKDKTVTLTEARYYSDSFTNLPVFTKSYEPDEEKNMNLKFTPREYSVVETPIKGFTPSYRPDKLVANQVGEINSYFTVTNTKVKYKVSYKFESGTEGKALPAEIEGFKPTDATEYEDKATVTAKEPTTKVFEVEDGTWTFEKWDANTKTVNKGDVTFEGTWIFAKKEEPAPDKYKVHYVFKSGTEGKALPAEIEGFKPTDATEYEDKATVTAKEPTTKVFEVEDGTWTFEKWDANTKTVNKGDVTFEGTWIFAKKEEPAPDKYKVHYVFKSGTEGKALPGEIDGFKPTDATEYEDKATVTAKEPTIKVLEIEDGTWTFEKWDANTKTVNKADVTFEGIWTFTEKKSDFTVEKTVDKETFKKAGDVLNYTVTVTNTGEKDLTDLMISDPKTTFDTPTFDLEKGESKEFKYAYTVTEEDVKAKAVINTVTVTHENVPKTATTESKLKEDNPNPPTKVVTQYVDEQGNKLISDKEGAQPVVEIKGYTYLRTEKGKDVIRHIYKKIPEDNRNTGGYIVWKNEPVSDDGLLNKKDHKAYMFGYPDGNFLPDRNMTREEVTAMFARLLKDYPRERRSYAIPYKDVTERDWSYEAIGFMTEKGIIKGYEDGSFRPKEAISRAEFAAMAARFDKLVAGKGNPFNDVPDTHWAVASIDSAAAKGWVSGYPDGSFKPERKITRSEVVSITNIMLDRYADKDFVRGHLPEMIPFHDLTEANWAYFPIMEATHGHDYTRKAPQEENWIRLNGEEFRFPLLYRK